MRLDVCKYIATMVVLLAPAPILKAQNTAAPADGSTAPAAPAAPAPLPTPSVTGPLASLPPAVFDAGPFGRIAVNGPERHGHVERKLRSGR